MKYILACLIFFNISVKAQIVATDIEKNDTSTYIEFKNYSGIILSKKCKKCEYMNYLNVTNRFTPSLNEIKKAEKALGKIYDQVNLYGKSQYSRNTLSDVTPFFSNYKRQYIGYINEKNEKVIYINLLNFKNPDESNKYFHDWKHEFIVGMDGLYESGMADFEYNLSEKKLTKP